VGFGSVPDKFVVGYGIDFNGRYRNLPDISAVDEAGELLR
jgi:hypoxanthine phosphoribosyltransferase